jgi:general stress protein YciG
MENLENEKTAKRGFASMDTTKQREIASKGGKASHQSGAGHEFTPAEARAAGRKGGEAVSRDKQHMAEIGRKGGVARSQGVRAARQQLSGMPPPIPPTQFQPQPPA